MLLRLFLLSFFFSLSLYAQPSLAQVQKALANNPALLDTPQAKAMMKEKGITKADVQAKSAKNKKLEIKTIESTDLNNTLTVTDDVTNNNKKKNLEAVDSERLNPFKYKTNKELLKNIRQKQQRSEGKKLGRYSAAFYANKNLIDSSSLVTPDNYTIAAGDILELYIYGDRDDKQELTVQNDGTVQLEYIGPVHIGGMSYKDAKEHIISQLKHHFKTSSFKLIISKYSSIQATLIGDVKNPGIYNLSSFSTVKDLLIVSRGVRKSASVRDIIVKRKGKVIADIDFYDLLFNGKTIGNTLLKHGDIVIVKQAKKLVSIDGYINNSAIFELKESENLDKLLVYAGGLKPNASKTEIKVNRFDNNAKRKTFKVTYQDSKRFKLKDGDSVYVYPLDFTANDSVNFYGNIIRPGTYSLNNITTLNEFFKKSLSKGMQKFFLPNTYFEYGVIKRYTKNLKYVSKSFNLLKVIDGTESVSLYPKDEVYIFNVSDIYSNAYVLTKGSTLSKPGKLQYIDGMTIQDVISISGINGILDDKVRVTSYATKKFMPKTSFYSLKSQGDTILKAYDEVEVYDYYSTHSLEPVTITGEVIKPTTVYYEKGMSLKTLLDIAGGVTKQAYSRIIEIIRYKIDDDEMRQREILTIDMRSQSSNAIKLQPYDKVKIFKIPNWNNQRTVTLKGEVIFPGTYSVENDEKLSSVIKRAGGYTKQAFIKGAVFTRETIRKQQMQEYNKSLAKVRRELALYNAMPANVKQSANISRSSTEQLAVVMEEAKKYMPMGRVSIDLNKNITKFTDSQFDLILQDQDSLTIPNRIDTITVFGEVFNPTSFVFDAEKSVDEYIAMASGLARTADSSNIYIVHANGISEPVSKSWFTSSIEIQKGDTIVVPLYIKETNNLDLWDSVSRILASFAITAATMTTLGVF